METIGGADYRRIMDFRQIKRGKENIDIITQDTIDKMVCVKLFESSAMNKRLHELSQKVMRLSMKKNQSREVGLYWDLETDKPYYVFGSKNSISLKDKPEIRQIVDEGCYNSIVFIHNHPRNGLFSSVDLRSFVENHSIFAMLAIGNDGNIHMMRKEKEFDSYKILLTYNENAGKDEYSGIKKVIKLSKKLGITYRFSTRRREQHEK